MTTPKKVDFAKLEKIDVTKHVEKKGRFSYLSWPYAVSAFRKACPDGYWKLHGIDRGQPYLHDESGSYVAVTVYTDADCPGFMQVHPVLNNKNKPIQKPDSFDINTSIQRCLVKAIALATGIGLHLYAGEDLPPGDEHVPQEPPKTIQQQQTELFDVLTTALDTAPDIGMLENIWADGRFESDFATLPEEAQATVKTTYENKKKQFAEQESALGGPQA